MDKICMGVNGINVDITKEPTDPICLRASIGGTKELGYYLVFRGDNVNEIENMLKDTLKAFRVAKIDM